MGSPGAEKMFQALKTVQATAIEPVKEETLAIEQMSNVICLIFTEIRYDVDSYRVSITESDSLNSIPMVQKESWFKFNKLINFIKIIHFMIFNNYMQNFATNY